jgi:hypothetical protein
MTSSAKGRLRFELDTVGELPFPRWHGLASSAGNVPLTLLVALAARIAASAARVMLPRVYVARLML